MQRTKDPQRTRTALLNAATAVVKQDGLNALTLDAVARAASVSKGGLLYHFPSREALVRGMVERLTTEFDQALLARMRATDYDRSPGAWLRAYIQANLDVAGHGADQSAALLAAIATHPELLDGIREHFASWQRRLVADGVEPGVATVVRLAMDGLFMAELLDLAPPDPQLRAQVIETLMRLTYPPSAAT